MSYIEIRDLSFRYRKQNKDVINNVSIVFNQGETTMIIGDNGSGKSTLCKLIMGILETSTGSIHLDGHDIKDMRLSDMGKRIGYLFQNPERQLFAMTVEEELKFTFTLRGDCDKDTDAKVDAVLTRFDLIDKKERLVHRLSYGEKQRLALASILINEPEFLILDEPTTGLDNLRKNELSKYIDKIKGDGVGLIIISHDDDFVKAHGDRILTIAGGKIIGDTIKEGN